MTLPLDLFFYPRSVAIVGVPRDGTWGYRFLESLREHNFRGELYAVNPRAGEIGGYPSYPNLLAIPGSVDLAIVCVPPDQVAGVVADAGAKGIGAAVVFTAGFGELGTEEGRRREGELLSAARQGGVRFVGPNCVGVLSAAAGLAPRPPAGLEELIDLTMALALLPKALGDRFAIISDPGGLAVGAADACEESGLSLATISPETEAKLRQFMIPVGASPKNPIDIGMMSFQPLEVYREAAVVAAQDPGVDAILVQPIVFNARTIDLFIEAKESISYAFLDSPVLHD